jgi:hypothetical protein
MKKWKDETSTLTVNLGLRDHLLQLVFLYISMLCWDQSLGSIGKSSSERPETRYERTELGLLIEQTAETNVSSSRKSPGVRFSNYLASMISCGVTTYRLLLLTVIWSIDTNVMELVLDNRWQLGGSFEHCNTFCTSCPSCQGEWRTMKEKRLKGIQDTDWLNECNFVYFVLDHIWYVFNPYISDIFHKKLHVLTAVALYSFLLGPALVFSLFEYY